MYDIIKKYVENKNENGLLLIDMPTGSGKTYNAIQFIYNSCMNPENKDRKYIFVTTLKKNLPAEDLKTNFERDDQGDLFKEKVLVIDSNMDSVVNGWSQEIEKAIPSEFKKTDEFKEFQTNVNFVKQQREGKNILLRECLPSIELNLREKSEPKFRRLISEALEKEYVTVESRILAIKTDKRWQWVGKLYPAVFTKDRQILFMSMDKFMSRNTTIVEPSYMFYNSDIIKNAVIFIDEFDATKDTILKRIIENGLRDKIDYIELFKDIYAALHTDSFPIALTTPSRERMNGKYSTQSLESVVDGIRDKADYIYETYSLKFKHRTSGNLSDEYQNYLFQDHQFHSILNANNSYVTMQSDERRRINSIDFAQKKPQNEKNNIQTMLGQLRGFISYFQIAVNILAINYMQCKKERRVDGEDDFSLESAIRTVLALFRLNDDGIDYLTGQIIMSTRKVKGEIEPADFDLSFYERGFRYYVFENDTQHDMQSLMMMYSFQNTPEKMLMKFCEKAKVIGISATATVPTVIGNYDIDYLANKMQKVYVEVSDEDKKRLSESFRNQMEGYKDINIHTDLLGCRGEYSAQSWSMIFRTPELANMVYGTIQRQFGEGEDKNDYNKKRYLRIAMAFHQFVKHDDIKSFLCVLNKHPRPKDRYLNKDVLCDIFEYIAKENGWNNFTCSGSIVFLDGSEYEDNKTNLIERLAKGEKIFVISVYQTIGAGQNLQYPVPDFLKGNLIRINDRSLREEKDFDAIYLDKPTNMIVSLADGMEDSEFVKYIYQMEFLQEVAEISSSEAIQNIKKAFRTLMLGRRNEEQFANIYKKKSVILMSTRYIIQAIGRICRTNQKNKNIYVFADQDIVDGIDISIVNERNYNPEFLALVDRIKMAEVKTPEAMSLENAASLKAVRVNKEIKNLLNNDWTEAKIGKWKQLRDLALTKPTATEEEAKKDFRIKNFYAQLPEDANCYYFSQQEDYNNVSVSFSPDAEHAQKVSAEGTRLKDMLRIPGIKSLFEENGWATEFVPNKYIMTPTLWNNIYKGALGEVVGKYLMEKALNIKLLEIEDPNLFELFDYQIDGCDICVDFKNWAEGTTENRMEMLRKVASKASKYGCKCVIIANIYAEDHWVESDTVIDGIRIVSLPYLVDGQAKLDRATWEIIRGCISEYKR